MISRRNFLSYGMKMGGGLTTLLASSPTLAAICGITPPQGEGPYYPEGDLERDSDLVQIHGGNPVAKGNVIYVTGKVLTGKDCKPIAGALVEIWQACHSGKYSHSDDPNALELDPNFQYWGRARTGVDGSYKFKTIVPGYYPTSATTYRPPHIHFKTHAKGFLSLTTQMYFSPSTFEDPATAKFVKFWNDKEKVPSSLLVDFTSVVGQKAKRGTFDIVMRPQ